MTSHDTFAATVARMRTAQKAYFKKRTDSCLTAAKDLEFEVDVMLRDIAPSNVVVAAETGIQAKLFG